MKIKRLLEIIIQKAKNNNAGKDIIHQNPKWQAYGREGLDKNMQMRHLGPHINSLVSTHAIDVDQASIMPQNCCVPDCTKKIDVEGGEKVVLKDCLTFWTKVY